MSTNQDQISRALEPIPGDIDPADDGFSPVMPFSTSLVLTRDQEKELVEYALQRKTD